MEANLWRGLLGTWIFCMSVSPWRKVIFAGSVWFLENNVSMHNPNPNPNPNRPNVSMHNPNPNPKPNPNPNPNRPPQCNNN
jgi:hypothetical protein